MKRLIAIITVVLCLFACKKDKSATPNTPFPGNVTVTFTFNVKYGTPGDSISYDFGGDATTLATIIKVQSGYTKQTINSYTFTPQNPGADSGYFSAILEQENGSGADTITATVYINNVLKYKRTAAYANDFTVAY